MDLMGSFSSRRLNIFNFFYVYGMLDDNGLVFLFDSGAICPVVGVNNFFDKGADIENRAILENILKEEISRQNISPRPIPLKAANSQEVETYPCICNGVSIENTAELDFYFDISFEDISIPLLGSSFIDDCAYNHAINGNVNITSMKEDVGKSYYTGYNLLDFNKVVARFENE